MQTTIERMIMEPPVTEKAAAEKTLISRMLREFREEAATTRRVLDRIPGDQLTWKPHTKSMSLGQLAWHIANTPGNISKLAQQESFDVTQSTFVPSQPNSLEEILAAHEQSVRCVEECLQKVTDQWAGENWRLMKKDQELFCKPRVEILRSI